MSITKPIVQITPEITIQPPLSRRGNGPGLVLIVSSDLDLGQHEKTLDPPPLQKWAEESYAVAQIVVDASNIGNITEKITIAVEALGKQPECSSNGKVGAIVIHTGLSSEATTAIQDHPSVAAAVHYGNYTFKLDPHDPHGPLPPIPVLVHVPRDTPVPVNVKAYTYPSLPPQTPYFTIPAHPDYNPGAASLSHTRSLTFLKPLLNGPYFDLEKIWDEHTYYEFGDRSVEETMATMVAEPYVNHVPTLTGGIGRANLTRFYTNHFIFSNPDDAKLELVSRTVGIDRIIDEFLFECTHNRTIDWLIPGIPPTNKPLSVPMTSIVNIRGDRLYHEHIAWDQGTVLRQLGLLPEYLPFPYPIPGVDQNGSGKYEYRVPVGGIETSRKLADETSEPSNAMLEYKVREVGKN
ncbi:hypothetical protein V8F20_011275 [Naviculisporaceae sp. PSN 640]